MQHIRVSNSYFLFISTLNETEMNAQYNVKIKGKSSGFYIQGVDSQTDIRVVKWSNQLMGEKTITSLHIWFVFSFVSYTDPNSCLWRLFDSLRLPSLIWQNINAAWSFETHAFTSLAFKGFSFGLCYLLVISYFIWTSVCLFFFEDLCPSWELIRKHK